MQKKNTLSLVPFLVNWEVPKMVEEVYFDTDM